MLPVRPLVRMLCIVMPPKGMLLPTAGNCRFDGFLSNGRNDARYRTVTTILRPPIVAQFFIIS
jgi:hypothetical protein